MRELFSQISILLDKVDFEKLWSGFRRYKFALYDDKNVLLDDRTIPYDTRFLGNTAIVYEGQYIAIWNVGREENIDVEVLAANLVHEMFHAYQFECGEKRFPQDLRTLDYPSDIENFKLKHAENKILTDAYLEKDIDEKKRLISKFISVRNRREQLIRDIIKCEYLSETAEGIAEYVGTMVLKQISTSKFNTRMENYLDKLSSLSKLLFDIRRISYYSGVVFLVVLSDSNISFHHQIGNCTDTVFEIVKSSLMIKDAIYNINDVNNCNIKELARKYFEGKKVKFDDFFAKKREHIEGHYMITGYDPMNMIKIDNRILCSHFIKLTDSITEEELFLKGLIVVELEPETINQVVVYYI